MSRQQERPLSQRLIFYCSYSDLRKEKQLDKIRSIGDNEVRTFGLDEGLKMAINKNPNYLFVRIRFVEELRGIQSDLVFLRTHFPFVSKILICDTSLYLNSIIDEKSFNAFLVPDFTERELRICMQNLSNGASYIHHGFAQKLENTSHLSVALTPQELKILLMIAEGLQNKKMAEKLFLSPHTVKNHKAKLMLKLGVKTTIELYTYAYDNYRHRHNRTNSNEEMGSDPG